eukprot:CAMPEP_0174998246 /NCGR_PEP_ID=MMETSP0005-20121125/1401_1 /TAXON_ID=420556 /ORGANISM="Ochromonas sp., Strain CCMP1393" /LENGTH=920 /DNA_ID=CAMNT_0016252859 /DNA_START=38 /DNA_END=2801 /DNA_ORIENTATION=-
MDLNDNVDQNVAAIDNFVADFLLLVTEAIFQDRRGNINPILKSPSLSFRDHADYCRQFLNQWRRELCRPLMLDIYIHDPRVSKHILIERWKIQYQRHNKIEDPKNQLAYVNRKIVSLIQSLFGFVRQMPGFHCLTGSHKIPLISFQLYERKSTYPTAFVCDIGGYEFPQISSTNVAISISVKYAIAGAVQEILRNINNSSSGGNNNPVVPLGTAAIPIPKSTERRQRSSSFSVNQQQQQQQQYPEQLQQPQQQCGVSRGDQAFVAGSLDSIGSAGSIQPRPSPPFNQQFSTSLISTSPHIYMGGTGLPALGSATGAVAAGGMTIMDMVQYQQQQQRRSSGSSGGGGPGAGSMNSHTNSYIPGSSGGGGGGLATMLMMEQQQQQQLRARSNSITSVNSAASGKSIASGGTNGTGSASSRRGSGTGTENQMMITGNQALLLPPYPMMVQRRMFVTAATAARSTSLQTSANLQDQGTTEGGAFSTSTSSTVNADIGTKRSMNSDMLTKKADDGAEKSTNNVPSFDLNLMKVVINALPPSPFDSLALPPRTSSGGPHTTSDAHSSSSASSFSTMMQQQQQPPPPRSTPTSVVERSHPSSRETSANVPLPVALAAATSTTSQASTSVNARSNPPQQQRSSNEVSAAAASAEFTEREKGARININSSQQHVHGGHDDDMTLDTVRLLQSSRSAVRGEIPFGLGGSEGSGGGSSHTGQHQQQFYSKSIPMPTTTSSSTFCLPAPLFVRASTGSGTGMIRSSTQAAGSGINSSSTRNDSAIVSAYNGYDENLESHSNDNRNNDNNNNNNNNNNNSTNSGGTSTKTTNIHGTALGSVTTPSSSSSSFVFGELEEEMPFAWSIDGPAELSLPVDTPAIGTTLSQYSDHTMSNRVSSTGNNEQYQQQQSLSGSILDQINEYKNFSNSMFSK